MKKTLPLVFGLLLAGCGSAGAATVTATAPTGEPAAVVVVAPTTTTTEPPPTTVVTEATVIVETVPPAPEVAEPPAPAVVPPLIDPGPDTRAYVLGLPVSDEIVDVPNVGPVHVVAWYSADHLALVFQRDDGSRALVLGIEKPQWSYVYEISPDPCAYDFFNGGVVC